MLGTNDGPVARALVYLSILRFFAAIPLAIVLRHYFNKPGFKSSEFSLVWDRSVEKYHQPPLYMPWTILAMPTIAFCWGIIFLIVALFTAIWHTGLSPNPQALEDVDPLTLMLSRLIISMMTFIDVTKVMPATHSQVN
ncbi:hypothetical protein DXG01_005000 [Tephrocybe rancida]|nr:hypothetical protein DXG01_005000 [Tephrocybe rancida]